MAQSDYFRRLFNNLPSGIKQEEGGEEERVVIPHSAVSTIRESGSTVDAMRALIYFTHHGDLNDDMMGLDDAEGKKKRINIFKLASKYRMTDLKELVEERLIEGISIDNVLQMALLADSFHSSTNILQVDLQMAVIRDPVRAHSTL